LFFESESLHVRVGVDRVILTNAHTSTADDGKLDVTFLTPVSTPGVFDEPEFSTVLLTPTNNSNSVVCGSSTLTSIVENTTFVGVEV